MFVGEYERSVDGTGRLALPAPFRDALGTKCYVTCHPEGFIAITTEAQFQEDAAEIQSKVRTGEQPRSALRDFGVSTNVAAIDKQGRITLDDTMRSHAGIAPGSEAIVAGSVTVLEVWRPTRYRTIRTEDGVITPARQWADA